MKEGGSKMEAEQGEPQPAKGNRLFTFLIGGVIVLVILGAFTLFQRRAQYHALAEETEVASHSHRGGHSSHDGGRPGRPGAAGNAPGLCRFAHLCAHERIPEEVVPRYRKPGAKGRAVGGYRHARSRSTTLTGSRGPEYRASERESIQNYGDAVSGPDQNRWSFQTGSR